jgi:hypothetical protein
MLMLSEVKMLKEQSTMSTSYIDPYFSLRGNSFKYIEPNYDILKHYTTILSKKKTLYCYVLLNHKEHFVFIPNIVHNYV